MSKLILHSHFQNPRSRLKRALENSERGRLIFLIGPTGVGKTTMRHAVLREMIGKPGYWGQGRIPVVEVMAYMPDQGYFNSKGLADAIIEELFTPNLRWMQIAGEVDASLEKIIEEVRRAQAAWLGAFDKTEPEYKRWQRVRNLLRARHTWLVCIEQAAALCKNRKNKEPIDHILHLMSVAEEGEANFLLTGVHHAAALWETRPEVRRRADIIWVRPYSFTKKADREPFMRVLQNLERRFRVSKHGLLGDMAADLMAATAGTFGVLEKVLEDAESLCQEEGRTAIRKRDIEDSYYSDKDLSKLWADVEDFEEVMKAGFMQEKSTQVTKQWQAGRRKVVPDEAPGMADDTETVA